MRQRNFNPFSASGGYRTIPYWGSKNNCSEPKAEKLIENYSG
jgi:hypothetical protein